jgi:trigger factor
MRVERTDKSATTLKLVITAEKADLEPIKKHVLSHFVAQTKVPGFRAGKAPLELLEKSVDQRRLMDEVMENAINDLYRLAIEKHEIRPMAQPEIQIKKFVPYSLLEFEAELEVLGEIKLPDYKKIKLSKPKVSIDAKEINEVVDSLRGRLAEKKEVNRPAKNSDEVTLDFAGKDEKGQPVAGADAKDYPLALGSGSFIPGFEENILGLKAGDEKAFSVTFPKDYGVPSLQNKKITFEVKIKTINELKKPEIDDKFAAKSGPFKTVAELKADIKKQLALEKQQQADRDFENKLVQEIMAQSKVQIPARLIDEQVMRMEDDEKLNLAQQGQTWPEHLKAEGITEEEHRQRNRPQAEERVKGGLVLSEIADQEKLLVTPEELEIRLQILKGQYQDPAMQAELDKQENRQDIAARLLTEKTLAKLINYAGN